MMNVKYIINSLYIALSVFLLAACSSDDDVAPVDSNQNVVVTFTMSIGNEEQVTRARNVDWTAYDSIPGHDFENTIDINRMNVVLYDTAGNFVSKVDNLLVRQSDTDSTKYTVEGTLRVDTLNLNSNTFNGKIAVFANTETQSLGRNPLSSDAIRDISYDYTPGSALTSIPMYGVKAVSNIPLTPGRRTDLGDIWLLRSMAKVNVNLTSDMTTRGYKLTRVTLAGYNTKGYLVPYSYDSISDTRLLSYDHPIPMSFHPYLSVAGTVVDNRLLVPDSVTFTGETLYLPEYNNYATSTPSTITVTIKDADGNSRDATFKFAEYDKDGIAGDPMNIVRNHAYIFNVYGNPIRIELKVLPWTVFTHPTIVI